jgi:hypothetical protein
MRAHRELLAGLSRELKQATARAYRDGWQRGGDRLGHQAAVQVLQQHGLELEDARAAAAIIIFGAARTAPRWMWRSG